MSLNTTPRTWTTSELVTAAMLNTEIRDALTGLQAAWTSYTPTLTSSGTQPTLGNGSANGRYIQIGKTIHFQASWQFGSTSTIGTGFYLLAIPGTAASVGFDQTVTGGFFDASGARHYVGRGLVNAGTSSITRIYLEGSSTLSASAPVVPASGDIIYAAGTVTIA